ncbi:hypothetical protein [Haloarchaeobius baliensis]|uniref:hypothetical protein n=1 Tax=Haloarchaeobius baliensis TaxID=1670458 RepID=UPI003F8841D7
MAGLWLRIRGIVGNAAVGFLVILLPALFERDYRFTMNPGIVDQLAYLLSRRDVVWLEAVSPGVDSVD